MSAMASAARLMHALTWLLVIVNYTHASPVAAGDSQGLSARSLDVVIAPNGTVTVYDPTSGQVFAQGSPSDGSGTKFSAAAIIWIVYCFAIGVPLAFTGIRLPRITTGAAVGFTATACLWAALINTESAKNLSDLVITLVPVCLFVPGFLFGFFNYGRLAGVILICIASGFSWGVRICLFRSDLLVREVYGDWLIGTAFAFLNVLLIPHFERIAVAIASASVGTFFIGLAIDLIVEKQAGMSLGLRLLCDRNKAHYFNLVYKGWKPSTATIIILAVSLAFIPLLAYGQHRLFPQAYILPPRNEDFQYKTRPLPRPQPEPRTPYDEEKAPADIAVEEVRTPTTPSKGSLRSAFSDSPPETRPVSQVTDSYFP